MFRLVPNEFMTQNEIDAARQVYFDELNVQNQPKITWPANFVIARAYLDQLARRGALEPLRIAALREAISRVDTSSSDRKAVAQLKTMAASLDADAAAATTPVDAGRMHALAAILKQSGTSRL